MEAEDLVSPKRVLYVDDDRDSCEMMVAMLEIPSQVGCELRIAQSVTEARALLQQQSFDLVVLDQFLSDGTGIEICQQLHLQALPPAVIFYSADVRKTTQTAALQAGAQVFLRKPEQLLSLVDLILDSSPP